MKPIIIISVTEDKDGYIKIKKEDFIKQIEQVDLLKEIEQYVSHFLPLVQQIYRLHIYGDFTFTQIAADLNISESTVKSHYYRLQKKIRKEFHDEYKGIIRS